MAAENTFILIKKIFRGWRESSALAAVVSCFILLQLFPAYGIEGRERRRLPRLQRYQQHKLAQAGLVPAEEGLNSQKRGGPWSGWLLGTGGPGRSHPEDRSGVCECIVSE